MAALERIEARRILADKCAQRSMKEGWRVLTPEEVLDVVLATPVAVMAALGGVYNGPSSGDLGLWRVPMTDEQHADAKQQWEAI